MKRQSYFVNSGAAEIFTHVLSDFVCLYLALRIKVWFLFKCVDIMQNAPYLHCFSCMFSVLNCFQPRRSSWLIVSRVNHCKADLRKCSGCLGNRFYFFSLFYLLIDLICSLFSYVCASSGRKKSVLLSVFVIYSSTIPPPFARITFCTFLYGMNRLRSSKRMGLLSPSPAWDLLPSD